MYKLVTIEDVVRIPPTLFNEPLKESALKILKEQYEGLLDKDLGLILLVNDIKEIGDGKILPGDGASYHKVIFEALVFKPELQEVIEGEITGVTEFGAFVNLGPMEGLVHISQITDDYFSFDKKAERLIGRDTKKSLKKGDIVRARIVTVSLKKDSPKIGLTMRQPGLGKLEWIEQEKKGGGK